MTKRSSSRVFLIPFLVGLITLIGSNYFIKPDSFCANSATCRSDLSLNVDNNSLGLFEGRWVTPPKIDLTHDLLKPSVLGADIVGAKHIYVNLATQTLYAYQGDIQIMQTRISSGKWGRTPVGNFNIWEKLRATRMAGGSGADAYNLPNVPYVMYFHNDFGLHGAYWHNNFGHEMSHGCVNMRIIDAETLFSWADGPSFGHLGTPVSVCSQFSPPNLCIQDSPIK